MEDLSRSERECSPGVLKERAEQAQEARQEFEFPGKHRREIMFWPLVEGLGLGTAVLRRNARDVELHCV